MKTIITLIALLLPCSALGGEMKDPALMSPGEFADQWERRHIKTTLEYRMTPEQAAALNRQLRREPEQAASQLRIVRCIDGTAAVQEYTDSYLSCGRVGPCEWITTGWHTLPAGCIPLDAAHRLYADELAWRNRPPAPVVKEPIEVIE